jgi:hypothetical protein
LQRLLVPSIDAKRRRLESGVWTIGCEKKNRRAPSLGLVLSTGPT